MLCIYVERCFESLICWLDPCLSSLLVAFISLCFSLLWKTPFPQDRQLLDRFSFIEPFFLIFSIDLNGILIHRDFWVSSQQILDSFFDPLSQNFWSFCLANRFLTDLIHRSVFAIEKSLTASRQIHFCRDLVLDRYFDPSSCDFYLRAERESNIISYFSLSTKTLFLSLQTFFFHSNLLPTAFSAYIKFRSLGKLPESLHFHAFMHF